MHCINRHKTQPLTGITYATVYMWFLGQILYSTCRQLQCIQYGCIYSTRVLCEDSDSFFYTVYAHNS